MTDTEIIRQILDGRKELYAELVNKYQNLVFAAIKTNFSGGEEEQEDLAQEVFFKAFRSLAQYRGQSAFSTWLYRIAINCLTDYARACYRQKKAGQVAQNQLTDSNFSILGPNPEFQIFSLETQNFIRQALAKLPDNYRQILFLYHYHGYSYTEISVKLGLSVRTVETRLYRAKKALRRILEVLDGEI